MTLRVDSEIGRLRRVLIHRPCREIDWMMPSHMQEHLFDDILDGEIAREEHGLFGQLFERAGVEALNAGTLLGEALDHEAAREELFTELAARRSARPKTLDALRELPVGELKTVMIEGYRSATSTGTDFDLLPVPNYLFQRDPQVVFGDRVLLSSMATEIRRREPLLAQILFRHHPSLAGAADSFLVAPPTLTERLQGGVSPVPTLEGGDLLVASPEILLIGLSLRTNRQGIERLADYLRGEPGEEPKTSFRHLLVVDIPPARSYMHLDTVFTFVDRHACLAYEPVIAGTDAATVFHVDLRARELTYTRRDSVLAALAELGMEVELIPCGGVGDRIHQEREQWTDGANAFAVAPGVIFLYRRNRRTVEELDRRGWRVLEEETVIADEVDLLPGEPTVVTILGNELSRARGGPRCMTMPLERDAL